MKARVTRYPNNEVRVAVFPERLPKDYLKIDSTDALKTSIEAEPVVNPLFVEGSDSSSVVPVASLDIKSKVDTEPRKPRLSLSKYGRATILRAGSCFSKGKDSERLLLTGTLPGSTYAAFKAIARFSTNITKKLTNWLTRHEPGCKWLYCWEFQGRGALHLHLVCEVGVSASQFIKSHFRDEWNRLLRSVGDIAKVDMYQKTSTYSHDPSKTQADVTVCDREPSRYVSKYVSKTSTHAKGFNRFPPSQWYQVSRSLLAELRKRTQIFESEGLSYGSARAFIENSVHNLQSMACAGYRLFTGSVLAWSGYGYSEEFSVESWGKNLMQTTSRLVPTSLIVKHALQIVENYPSIKAYARSKMSNEMLTLARTGMLSETEMLMLIQTIMETTAATWERMRNKTQAANFLQRSINWWENKYGYTSYTDSFRSEINKICEENLTG